MVGLRPLSQYPPDSARVIDAEHFETCSEFTKLSLVRVVGPLAGQVSEVQVAWRGALQCPLTNM